MGDQAERVILEAEDNVTPITSKVNAGLDGFDKKAQASGERMVRVNDQTRSSVQRLITSLEKQADVYGKSGVDKLIAQREQLLLRHSREPAAIDAITKSYQRMIEVEAKAAQVAADAERKRSDARAAAEKHAAGESARGWVQDPLGSLRSNVTGLLMSMGPLGGMIAGGAAALTAYGLAAWEAAKGLGEYGVRIRDVELRTGLTSKEVGQFSFAAKAVGEDIGIVERMMRGLSQALDENSEEGGKARGMLQKLHVTMYDATTGGIKPTSQALQEISAAIAGLPTALERDAASMALFKRAGIEAVPMMTELAENLKVAKEHGYGPSEEDVQRYLRYQRSVTVIETAWAGIVRHMKEALVPSFEKPPNVAPATSWVGRARNFLLGADRSGKMGRPTGWLGFGRDFSDPAAAAEATPAAVPAVALSDAQQARIESAMAAEGESGQLHRAQKELEETQKKINNLKGLGAPWSKIQPLVEKADQEKSTIEGLRRAAEEGKRALEELHAFRRQVLEFAKKGDESELSAGAKIYYARDQLLEQAKRVKASEGEILAIRRAADEQAAAVAKKDWAAFEKYDADHRAENKRMDALWLPGKDQMKVWEEGFAAQERIAGIGVDTQREEIKRRAGQAGRMAMLAEDETPTAMTSRERRRAEERKEGRAAVDAYQARVDLAVQLAGIEADRIAREENSAKKLVLAAEAQKDLSMELSQAQDELELKRAEIQHKRTEDVQAQLDGIQKTSERLFETLFTKPMDFGKELWGTVKAAAIKPATEMLSSATANLLHPILYGKDGTGGMAGMFGGGSGDPVRVSTDQNTAATMQNSVVMAGLTALLAAGMGVAAPAIGGGAGLSMPAISVAMPATAASSWGGGFSPTAFGMGGWGAGGGGVVATTASASGPSFADLVNLPGGRSAGTAAAMNPLAMLMGGGKSGLPGMSGLLAPGGLAKSLASMKGAVWNQSAWDSYPSTAGGYLAGGIQGVATSPAAGTAGMMLATNGLIGHAGTWGGALEGAAGGALIGNQIGGPIGAAAGASFGFEIGAMEKLFGVKSLAQTAHDDVKSVYGVSIPTNSGTIKQIVSLAQSQFGGSISVAVRSPSVRQLVMLYSEATGQKMPLSATTPYGGSLQEQGGKLYQQASYQDGQAHVFASSLPTLGGVAANTYPTPGGGASGGGGPTYVSLNIGGSDAAGFLTGQYVTPGFVTDQAMAAQGAGYGRTQQSANMNLPGLTVA